MLSNQIAQNNRPEVSSFFIAGINYKKTNSTTRGIFAIDDDAYDKILSLAPSLNIKSLFIISTCNRTEIYGFANDANSLIDLLCSQTKGGSQDFKQLAYVKNDTAAVEHLFNVAAGLDSQILGDYEIIGQLKNAMKFAKERGMVNCTLERMFNTVLESSKEIKNSTALSDGTISVSFAAVQYIKQHICDCRNKKVLLLGTGKIGRNTCKNLVDYLGIANITLINRSEKKAQELARELNLQYAPIEQLPQCIDNADIILVATNAVEPVIVRSDIRVNTGEKFIIDLSIPYNVDAAVGQLPGVTLVNVDEVSKLKDCTIRKRESEIPKAQHIIRKHMSMFTQWQVMRRHAPTLHAIKLLLGEIAALHRQELANPGTNCPYIASEQKIQQIVNKIAGKMRVTNGPGCYHLEAINEFMKAVPVV